MNNRHWANKSHLQGRETNSDEDESDGGKATCSGRLRADCAGRRGRAGPGGQPAGQDCSGPPPRAKPGQRGLALMPSPTALDFILIPHYH